LIRIGIIPINQFLSLTELTGRLRHRRFCDKCLIVTAGNHFFFLDIFFSKSFFCVWHWGTYGIRISMRNVSQMGMQSNYTRIPLFRCLTIVFCPHFLLIRIVLLQLLELMITKVWALNHTRFMRAVFLIWRERIIRLVSLFLVLLKVVRHLIIDIPRSCEM
jgi:hypothetical protein